MQHYSLEFTPPVISILEGVPFGAEVRKHFKVCYPYMYMYFDDTVMHIIHFQIFNPNNSIVEYSWNSYADNVMGIVTVDPPTGSIGICTMIYVCMWLVHSFDADWM